AILDSERFVFDPAQLAQALSESVERRRRGDRIRVANHPEPRDSFQRRLGSGSKRRCEETQNPRNEPSPVHYCISSSARTSTDGGTGRPRAFAVLRLIPSSNFVGCSTERSPGLAPRRSRST